MKPFRSLLLGCLLAVLPLGHASGQAAEQPESHGYTLEFYSAKWCGPCYRIKSYLKAENSQQALTLQLADGTLMTIPIVEVDVPGSYDASRYEAGAVDIYGRPRIPQFQVKQNGVRTDAFLFPWPTNAKGRRQIPADFSAATALGTRLAIGLKLEANIVIPASLD